MGDLLEYSSLRTNLCSPLTADILRFTLAGAYPAFESDTSKSMTASASTSSTPTMPSFARCSA